MKKIKKITFQLSDDQAKMLDVLCRKGFRGMTAELKFLIEQEYRKIEEK